MDELKMIKEKAVNDYISNIDLENIDVDRIKKDLQGIIQEIPAVKLNYIQQELLTEENGEQVKKKMEKLDSLEITFTYDRTMEVKTPNGEIKSQTYYLPYTKKYLI